MSATEEEKELWAALSDLFVDSDPDYEYIGRVAKNHPYEQVRFAFYHRVAPVCIYNAIAPIPPVWGCFDREELYADIAKHIEEESRRLIFGDAISFLGRLFVWVSFRGELAKVKAAMDRAGR